MFLGKYLEYVGPLKFW